EIERAQSAGPVLEIGFEVVRRVVETREALALLGALRREVLRGRPDRRIVDELRERITQRARARKTARVEEIRGHRDVGTREIAAVAEFAHRVAGLEADVPEAREERFEHVRVTLQRAGLDEHEQVDIRMRKERAAPEAADREQRGVGRLADAGAEHVYDD